MLAALEQAQVAVARAREQLGLPGLSVDAALNFRDKSRMKDVLRGAGLIRLEAQTDRHGFYGDLVYLRLKDEEARDTVGGSLEFSKLLLHEAKVAVSPGVGFGDYGDDHVRFSLIENEHRTRQAVRGIKQMFREDARTG